MTTFAELVAAAVAAGGFTADDAINAVLPLFDDVEAIHDQGWVAALRGTDHLLVDDRLRVHLADDAAREPLVNEGKLAQLQHAPTAYLDVVGRSTRTVDLGTGADATTVVEDAREVIDPDEPVEHPVLVTGWVGWEHLVDHHDQLTDVLSIGLVLAALAVGVDFGDRAQVERFAANRTNLFRIKADLHPIVAQVIVQMTEPDRRLRAADLESLEQRLRTYRDQPVDFDLDRLEGATTGPVRTRRTAIQAALRDQLFDLSRRNRLLHFVPSQSSIDLTLASVPLLLDVRNITADQLFVWHPPLADRIVARQVIGLDPLLRFEDAPYLPGSLDKLIAAARRARAEYGIAQLRLVTCFLRWHNVKATGAERDERIHSPLLLLPVELVKKRGVRDRYQLTATSSEAEVNPALRHHLGQLYGLALPESVDLAETSIEAFHAQLQAMIHASEPAVELLLVDRPQIELVHQKAKLRVDQYRRRQGAARARAAVAAAQAPTPHSYDPRHLVPRGLQLYLAKVRPAPLPIRSLVDAPPTPRGPTVVEGPGVEGPVVEGPVVEGPMVEQDTERYRLAGARTGNPYRWELDLCAVTLAHLSYRNMTLVRDYDQLVESDRASAPFDQIFSLEAKPDPAPVPAGGLPVREQHLVVPADATQLATVAQARHGQSFIIQGPPGTGKSQTITNLIADHVAAGKRVLFVCEKRAAIDVVHARLRQQGLDELCALIHDSQADKRSFVMGLKATYEAWREQPDALAAAEGERGQVQARIEEALAALEHLDRAMAADTDGPGSSLRALYERAISLAAHRFDPDPLTVERLPRLADWFAHRPTVDRVAAALSAAGASPILAEHPLRHLGPRVLDADRPLDAVTTACTAAASALDGLRDAVAAAGLDPAATTVGDAEALVGLAGVLRPLTDRGLGALVDPASPASTALDAQRTAWFEALRVRDEAAARTTGWRNPLPPADARAALDVARAKEPKALKFLNGAWRSVRKTVRARYDFAAHAVAPTITTVLDDLVAAQDAQAALEAATAEAWTTYGTSDHRVFAGEVAAARAPAPPAVATWRARIGAGDPAAAATVAAVADAAAAAATLAGALVELLAEPASLDGSTLADAAGLVGELRGQVPLLAQLVEPLRLLAAAPPAIGDTLRTVPVSIAGIEHAVTVAAIDRAHAADRTIERVDARRVEELVAQLRADADALLDLTAKAIRHRARARFTAHVAANEEGYVKGRKVLEHEFGKSMRYKSIRELAGGDSRAVLFDLRPIWLMSPLSVSDTLPLDPDQFDVVIFDEASQVPLEEAVPALYRAQQVVIVGDQMQLPPTQFFTTAPKGDDVLVPAVADELDEEHRIGVTLDGDSFLAQSDTALASTMLSWHYRSRSEALIGFSNAAFYGGRLATVPDRHVVAPTDVGTGVDALLARSISVHRVAGVYDARRNLVEADHVAALVRELLERDTGRTIGVVAFSEAQQGAIEEALDRLAADDADFAARYEAEQLREDDGQHVGLFVKNLENVQGDERDIVILSICYAPAPDGRMRMNFGPINQRGGEKRLNVIFSRAKHHMAVVTTIDHTAITNELNLGANTLRQFLQYADAVDRADAESARRVLRAVDAAHGSRPVERGPRSVVVDALARALAAQGFEVALDVGESAFTCDVAIRRPGDDHHRLGLLVDTAHRCAASPASERAIAHPRVLASFGWSIGHVLTKDWYQDPERVVADVVARVDREP